MKINLPIIYSQGDSRWGANMLGFNKNLPYNMANFGCLVTCWAMVDRYFGKDTDPGRLNTTFSSLGAGKAFTANGGDYIPGGNNLVFGDIKEKRTLTPSLLVDGQISEIKTSIDNGHPVIICLDYNPKTVQADTHFVVVVDYNPNDENDMTIADPINGTVRSLKNYLGWYKPNMRNTIESYVCVTGPKPKINAETIAVPKSDFENMVKKSTQHDKMVEYLKPGADPNSTLFEDLQTVVAGIKSTATDLSNKLKEALTAKDIAETELANQVDKVANISSQYEQALKTKQHEYEALKSTIPDMEKLKGQYIGTIDSLTGQLREAQKEVGAHNVTITGLKRELSECKKGISAWTKVLAVIKKYLPNK